MFRYQQRASGKGRDWATPEDGWIEGEEKKFDHPYLQVQYQKHKYVAVYSALAKWEFMSLLLPTYSIDDRTYLMPHLFFRGLFPPSLSLSPNYVRHLSQFS